MSWLDEIKDNPVVIVLGFFAVVLVALLLFVPAPNSVTCAKCGKSDHKFNRLILHVVTEDKKKLAIPYCPKCCVEVMNSPSLTWAGNR